jgi:hypothetical protein
VWKPWSRLTIVDILTRAREGTRIEIDHPRVRAPSYIEFMEALKKGAYSNYDPWRRSGLLQHLRHFRARGAFIVLRKSLACKSGNHLLSNASIRSGKRLFRLVEGHGSAPPLHPAGSFPAVASKCYEMLRFNPGASILEYPILKREYAPPVVNLSLKNGQRPLSVKFGEKPKPGLVFPFGKASTMLHTFRSKMSKRLRNAKVRPKRPLPGVCAVGPI